MKPSSILTLPGWQGSSPEHWQSRWERRYGYVRVEQHDWQRPLRGDWHSRREMERIDAARRRRIVRHLLRRAAG